MKFTLEDAYKELVSKMTSNGEKLNVTERTLKKHVETLMKYASKSNDEIELSDFITEIMPDCKELDGQYRKDNSDFIKKWEEDHKTTPPNPTKKQPTDGDDYAKTLEERIAMLEKKELEFQKKTAIENKKSELLSAMKKKGIKDEDWCKSFLAEVSIDENLDVESKADTYVNMYNKLKASDGGVPTPKGTSGKTSLDKHQFEDVFDALKKDNN